jgi:phosphoserine phosphatase RsbU/P
MGKEEFQIKQSPAPGRTESCLMSHESERPHVLACSEVWGGNRKVVRRVELPGLLGWVASVPLDKEEGGGDLHYLSVCDYDLLSRVALADVSGHGREVSKVTETLYRLMRENVNAWDQSDFMRGINQAFRLGGDGKYATAFSLSYHRLKGRLAFTNAGHLPPLWYHAAAQTWGWLEEVVDPRVRTVSGLPVGLIPGTDYLQTVVTLAPSDILVLYTDGITEAENTAGQDLGRQQFLEWARLAPVDSPASTGETLMERLEAFRGCVHTDDETLLVLQREKESLPKVLGELAGRYAFRGLNKVFKSS